MSREKVLATFLHMPHTIAEQILEKLEPLDLLRSRKVCLGLKFAVDRIEMNFNKVVWHLYPGIVSLLFDDMRVNYHETEDGGTTVHHNGQKKRIEGEQYKERSIKDLAVIFKHASILELYNLGDNVKLLVDILKDSFIHVESIKLNCITIDKCLAILSRCKTKVLKNIDLFIVYRSEQFERITHLEQWKNSRTLKCWADHVISDPLPIEQFFHFEQFEIEEHGISIEKVISIRDNLLKRSTFRKCTITLYDSDPDEFLKVFKPEYDGGNNHRVEYLSDNNIFVISYGTTSRPWVHCCIERS